jgi:hypothetical protein
MRKVTDLRCTKPNEPEALKPPKSIFDLPDTDYGSYPMISRVCNPNFIQNIGQA